MVASGPLDGFLARRAQLIATATPGTAAARALSDLTDEAILERSGVASSTFGAPFAVFALGGYGARRLLPYSDIDLLIVSTGTRADLEPLVRGLLYPIWDAGISLGHQIRSPKMQVQALRDDLHNTTGFLTARFLAGDDELAGRMIADGFRRIRRDVRATRKALFARARPGSPYLLEPDLKDGAGGQRDVDEIVWHAALLTDAPASDTSPLLAAGLLTPPEQVALEDAGEQLTAARWLLHRANGRGTNRMSLDDASVEGLDADGAQRALEVVHHTLLSLHERLGSAREVAAGGFTLAELRALADAGDPGVHAAERAAFAGRLEGPMPGFGELMTLRRPALSHHHTVGAHSLRAVAAVGEELAALGPGRVSAPLRDATLVAALAHDAGKRIPAPGHAARGAGEAERAAFAFGLAAEQAQMAGTLAGEHLLLSDMVTHADLSDEDAVLAAAARIGDPRLVAALYALTAADLRATGPDVWTAWRAALVGDLAAKLEGALSPDVNGAGIFEAAEATRREALRRAASAGASRTVLAFLEHAPLRYLARRTPEEVLRDARLVQVTAGPGAPGRFAFSVAPGPVEGTWVVDVVTRDRPGLFAILSGTLALAGLDALAAEAHTDRTGIALDTFTVTSATRAAVGTETWNSFERMMEAALKGVFELDLRLAERRRHYPAVSAASTAPVVEIGPRGTFTTTVRVRTADRVGLLHDLARAFQVADLDIRRATITTLTGVAADTFEVTDAEGAPPEPDVLRARLVPLLERASAP